MSSNQDQLSREEEIRRRIEARMNALSSSNTTVNNHNNNNSTNEEHVDPTPILEAATSRNNNENHENDDDNHNNNNDIDDDDDDDIPPPPPIDTMPEDLRRQLRLPPVRDVNDDSGILGGGSQMLVSPVDENRLVDETNSKTRRISSNSGSLELSQSIPQQQQQQQQPIMTATNEQSASDNDQTRPSIQEQQKDEAEQDDEEELTFSDSSADDKEEDDKQEQPGTSSSPTTALAASKKKLALPDLPASPSIPSSSLSSEKKKIKEENTNNKNDNDEPEQRPQSAPAKPLELSSVDDDDDEDQTLTLGSDDDDDEKADEKINHQQKKITATKLNDDENDSDSDFEIQPASSSSGATRDKDTVPKIETVFSATASKDGNNEPSLRNIFGDESLPSTSIGTGQQHIDNFTDCFDEQQNNATENKLPSSSPPSSTMQVKTFAARREEGRCLAPSSTEEFVSSPISVSRKPFSRSVPSSESLQLNFFSSNQKVVGWRNTPEPSQNVIWGKEDQDQDQEQPIPSVSSSKNNDKTKNDLGSLRLWSDLERNAYKEDGGDRDDDDENENEKEDNNNNSTKKLSPKEKERIESSIHTMIRSAALRSEPRLYDYSQLRAMMADPLNESSVSEITQESLDSVKSCDILSLWDTVRDSSRRDLSTFGRFWTSDHNATASSPASVMNPLPLPAQFSRGVLLKLSINSVSTQFHTVFGGPIADPIFLSLALYAPTPTSSRDPGKTLIKLSETFYFTPQGQPLQDTDPLLHPGTFVTFVPNEFVQNADPRVSHSFGKLIFILRVYRKLSSDWEYSSDMYVRPGSYRTSYHQSMQKAIVESSQHAPRRGPLLQELGFGSSTIVSLFGVGGSASMHASNNSSSSASDLHHTTSTNKTAQTLLFDKLFKSPKNLSDATTFRYIADDNKKAIANLKSIDIRIMMSVEAMNAASVEPQIPRLMASSKSTAAAEDESFIILHEKNNNTNDDNNSNNNNKEGTTTKKIDEKRLKQEMMIEKGGASPAAFASRYVPCCRPLLNAGCFSHYVNVLYLRLQKLNLTKLSSKIGGGNFTTFAIQVCLKENDDTLHVEGIPCVYTRFFGVTLLEPSGFSASAFGTRECEFNDEFKIQLPIRLHEKHHLFFTIYGMTDKCTAEEMKPIGHGLLPLYRNGGVSSVCNAETLQVQILNTEAAKDIGDAYCEKIQILPPGAFLCGGESILSIGTSMRSTVQTTHLQLSKAFSKIEQICERATVQPKSPSERFMMSTDGKNRHKKNPDELLDQSIRKTPTSPNEQKEHRQGDIELSSFLSVIDDLPSPELVAFGPLLLSTCLAVICSPSLAQYSLDARADTMRTFIIMAQRIHQLEVSLLPSSERLGFSTNAPGTSVHSTAGTNRPTTLTLFLYNTLTRDLFFTNGRSSYFVVAPLFAEVLCYELSRTTSAQYSDKEVYLNKITDILWFLLDLILRDVALQESTSSSSSVAAGGMEPHVKVAKENSEKFAALSTSSKIFIGSTIKDLVCLCVEKLCRGGTLSVVQRLSIFLRSLLCLTHKNNSNNKLMLCVMQHFLETLEQNTSLTFALVAVRFWLDLGAKQFFTPANFGLSLSADALHNNNNNNNNGPLPLPLPQFLLRIILRPIYRAFIGNRKDLRAGAIILLHGLLDEVSYLEYSSSPSSLKSNSSNSFSTTSTFIAIQLLPLIHALGWNYSSLRPLLDDHSYVSSQATAKSNFHSIAPGLSDRRLLSAIVMWVLQTCPVDQLETWIKAVIRKDVRSATGLLALVSDSVSMLHYTSSLGKVDRWSAPPTTATKRAAASSSSTSSTKSSTTLAEQEKNDTKDISNPDRVRIRQSADLRVAGASVLAASRLIFIISREMYSQLSTVSSNDSASLSPLVYPFFRLLEVIISEAQPTLTQQVGALVVYSVTRSYFSEIIQGRARFAPGMVLLGMRLILSSSGHVRAVGSAMLLDMTRCYFVAAKEQETMMMTMKGKNNNDDDQNKIDTTTTSKNDKNNNNSSTLLSLTVTQSIIAGMMNQNTIKNNNNNNSFIDILKKFRTLFSAATISVAESYQHGRNMKFAKDSVEDGLNSLNQLAVNCDATSIEHQNLLKNPEMMFFLCRSGGGNNKDGNDKDALSSSATKSGADLAASTGFRQLQQNQQNQQQEQNQQLDIGDFAPWVKIHSTTQTIKNSDEEESKNNSSNDNNDGDAAGETTHQKQLLISSFPSFASFVDQIVRSSKTLFNSIGQLPTSPEMRIKSIRPAAFLEVVWKFIDQKALRDVPRWIALLVETNKSHGDFLEAALSHVLAAAFAYRVTQLFYKLHGFVSASSSSNNNNNQSKSAGGASSGILPIFFNIISWHDYCRLFPQLEHLFSEQNLHHLVVDAVSLPDHSSFSIDGQVALLKTAAELFGKAHLFEWAIMTIRLVDTIVLSREDFRSCKLIADAIGIWCGHIASFATAAPKRLQSRYYCVAVSFSNNPVRSSSSSKTSRGTRRPPEFRIFRYPYNSSMTLGLFKEFAKDMSSVKYRIANPASNTILSDDLSTLAVVDDASTRKSLDELENKKKNTTTGKNETSLESTLKSVAVFSEPATPEEQQQPITVHCFEVHPLDNDDSDDDENDGETLTLHHHHHQHQKSSKTRNTSSCIGKVTKRFQISRRLLDQKSNKNNNDEQDDNDNDKSGTKSLSSSSKKLSLAARQLNVNKMKKNVIVFTVEAGFPNVATNLPVTRVQERILDPLSTATETVLQQRNYILDKLSISSSSESNDNNNNNNNDDNADHDDDKKKQTKHSAMTNRQIIPVLFTALTPFDIRPAGYYFTQLVRNFTKETELRNLIKSLVSEIVQKYLEQAATALGEDDDRNNNNNNNNIPEQTAACWKAVVDIDCAIKDVEDILEKQRQEEGAVE